VGKRSVTVSQLTVTYFINCSSVKWTSGHCWIIVVLAFSTLVSKCHLTENDGNGPITGTYRLRGRMITAPQHLLEGAVISFVFLIMCLSYTQLDRHACLVRGCAFTIKIENIPYDTVWEMPPCWNIPSLYIMFWSRGTNYKERNLWDFLPAIYSTEAL
jgi:hypothetical protein